MDELAEGIFMVAIGALLVAAVVAIVAALLSIGGLYGAGVSIYNYFNALTKNVKPEAITLGVTPSAAGEPAIKSYFFGKGYIDLKATINDCLKENQKFSEKIWKDAASAQFVLLRAVHYGAALSCAIYGTLFFGLLSIVHIVILGGFYLAIYVLFTLVFVVEKIYLTLRGFLTVCPICHTQTSLPVYLCDGCGSAHHKLLPSSYGTFHHRCTCGKQLPSTFFLNRGRLPAKCANCNNFLSRAHTEARKQFVPVIGGPSTGKTAYLVWLVDELKRWAVAEGQDFAFLNPSDAAAFETRLRDMRRGNMPNKTTATTPSAINVTFSRSGRLDRNLYVYDPAGEAFLGEQELVPHEFLGYCSGVLLLIDPFSIPAVQYQYGIDPSRANDLKPSVQRPDDLLDRLVFVLEKHFGVDPAARITMPIAIVLTKVDAFNLEATIGDDALSPSMAESKRETARNDLISRQLCEWGMTPLVEAIETRFSKRSYFTCSAVGLARASGAGFAPERIAMPFLWLMDQTRRVQRLRRMRLSFAAVATAVLVAGGAFAGKMHFDDEVLYNNARGDIPQLKSYLATCTICWSGKAARAEIVSIPEEERTYGAARGSLSNLKAYVDNCKKCAFKTAAQGEIKHLERNELAQQEKRAYDLARGNLAALRSYVNSCQVCTFKTVAQNEISQLERSNLAQQEQRTYNSARGNLSSLRSYVNSCQVCGFKTAAEEEIKKIERDESAKQEAQTYRSAGGNLAPLRTYVNSCQVCAFKSAAENDIRQLERNELTVQERSTYSSARGNIDLLRAYVRGCRICDFETAARNEISEMERLVEEEARRRNPTVMFKIGSNHPNAVALSFHSAGDKSRVWPENGQVYILSDSNVHDYRLACEPGESICYGAWVNGGPLSPYWGAGYNGREGCRNCCFTCPTGETSPIVLEPRDAKRPTPSITWQVRSEAPYSVAVAFFSSTRPNRAWPGGDQVWVINDSELKSYKLTCMAGETICYGAWAFGNRMGAYWGVGSNRQHGCTSCCRVCNGGETDVIVLNP
jgi:hypothetical protein